MGSNNNKNNISIVWILRSKIVIVIETQKLFFRECCFDGPLRRVCPSFPTGSAAANIWNLSPKNVMWPITNLLRSKWWSFVSVCPSVCDLTPPVLTDFLRCDLEQKQWTHYLWIITVTKWPHCCMFCKIHNVLHNLIQRPSLDQF
jgi:hypothetical protein